MAFFNLESLLAAPLKILMGAAMLLLGSFGASAQTLSRTQDFSGGPITTSTYGLLSNAADATNSGAAGFFLPNFTQSGFGAFGSSDQNASTVPNTIPVVFQTQVFGAGSTNNQVTFQLGQKGQFGFDDNNRVEVRVTIGGVTVTALTILGPTSGAPEFNIGSGASAVGSYTVPTTVTQGNIATNQNPSAGSIANFTVLLPSFTTRTNVDVTIVIRAARKSIVLIDNVTISSSAPLPVELTRFGAVAKSQAVSLSWATASEKNNDHFEVQRSATGREYATIGAVKGHGSTTMAHDYSFVDSRPLAGTSYYRLRQVDADGTFSFSPVAAVQTEAGTKVLLYPNPSANQLILPAGIGAVRYRMFNALGQTLLSGKATDNDRLDITSLPKGPFFLELSGATGHRTQRLMRE